VTRTFAIPGLLENAIGMKQIEEAVAIRNTILTSFDRAAGLPPGPERTRLLTVTFVGAGFSGIEGFGETLSFAHALLRRYPEINANDLAFHLVEASSRVLPEVGERPARWVVRHLRSRGGRVHLNTQLRSAVDGHIVLSNGEEYDSALIVWTAGNGANPVVARHTDLPLDERGFVTVGADLRVVDLRVEGNPVVEHAWAAGDDASVPDLAGSTPGGAHCPERSARCAAGQGPGTESGCRRPWRQPAGLRAPFARGGRDAGRRPRDLPVPLDRHQRVSRLAYAPWLPRPRGPVLGA
jgi:NADH dehydrogenase